MKKMYILVTQIDRSIYVFVSDNVPKIAFLLNIVMIKRMNDKERFAMTLVSV